MLSRLREEGYGPERLELWSIGHPGNEPLVEWYCGDSEAAAFVDTDDPELSAYALYGAFQDDLVILDGDGVVRHHVSLLSFVLDEEPNRTTLDGWVQALLP